MHNTWSIAPVLGAAVPVCGSCSIQPRATDGAQHRAGADLRCSADIDAASYGALDHPERERGTMENLLAMPVRPIEVMLAKIVPYVFVGYIQVVLILAVSAFFFQVPIRGSVALLLVALGLFISSNLALGITYSTVAANQMQAIQFALFTLLPSILLSGFLYPFKGMPVWAQWAGEIIPATHAMRVVRGLLLKGNRLPEILPELWPIALFAVAAIMIAVWFYRETLD
jgi:ABC-2 type transport system permease protein